ncbi:MAG: hypothetical protein JNM39_04690 [Bdellovibrionaceae bacterium]|nr:hypothetical protein [Pseudobdellovibrionaceae bacterium]
MDFKSYSHFSKWKLLAQPRVLIAAGLYLTGIVLLSAFPLKVFAINTFFCHKNPAYPNKLLIVNVDSAGDLDEDPALITFESPVEWKSRKPHQKKPERGDFNIFGFDINRDQISQSLTSLYIEHLSSRMYKISDKRYRGVAHIVAIVEKKDLDPDNQLVKGYLKATSEDWKWADHYFLTPFYAMYEKDKTKRNWNSYGDMPKKFFKPEFYENIQDDRGEVTPTLVFKLGDGKDDFFRCGRGFTDPPPVEKGTNLDPEG